MPVSSRSNTSWDFVERTISSSVDLVVRREAFRFGFLISDTRDKAAFELRSCCEALQAHAAAGRESFDGFA
jgi:hypothetical protein